jgi:flavin-dependent dehydrogenase
MIVGGGWYIGIAPVPGERVNLGLVLGESDLRRRLNDGEPAGVVDAFVRSLPDADGLVEAAQTDAVAAHLPLVHRVRHTAGNGYILVGDAAGFVDPLSGEGLHRALVSAEMAAHAIDSHLSGDQLALQEYDRRLRARFRSQGRPIVGSPAVHAPTGAGRTGHPPARPRGRHARNVAAALADLVPATTVLDPRFVARLVA